MCVDLSILHVCHIEELRKPLICSLTMCHSEPQTSEGQVELISKVQWSRSIATSGSLRPFGAVDSNGLKSWPCDPKQGTSFVSLGSSHL